MAFDGLTLFAVAVELESILKTSRVTRVFQPGAHMVILRLRRPAATYDLLVSAEPSAPRMHLTRRSYENPQSPHPFCMVLRKYLEGTQYLFASQAGLDRVLRIVFGSKCQPPHSEERFSLYCELTGRTSNIVLVEDSTGMVLGAIKLTTRGRQIVPGAVYEPPPPQGKLELLDSESEEFELSILRSDPGQRVDKALMDGFSGLGPLTSRELAERAGVGRTRIGELTTEQRKNLVEQLLILRQRMREGHFDPSVLLDGNGVPKDVSPIELTHLPSSTIMRVDGGIGEALDSAFGERFQKGELTRAKSDLSRPIQNLIARLERKREKQRRELEEAENADIYRIYGELLTANLHTIEKGQKLVSLPNYYDPEGGRIDIPLAPDKSPVENAQSYFKKYRKLKNARSHLERELRASAGELDYLRRTLTLAELAEEPDDLVEIRSELESEGFLKSRHRNDRKRRASHRLPPLKFRSSEGYEILVGRNNSQNDLLTGKTAAPTDIWLHTQKIHGSHVILRIPGAGEPTGIALREAACLAALYSKARNSSNVPVDYTRKKHVWKPSGARPGFVLYDSQKTLFVDPDPGLAERLSEE